MKLYLSTLAFAASSAVAGVVGSPGTIGMMGPEINTNLIPGSVAGYTTARTNTQTVAPTQYSSLGDFRTVCGFSHMNWDDPLVWYNQPNKAHLHTFFGNTSVNAASTDTSLGAAASSTCSGGTLNKSAYWVPAMVDTRTGLPLTPQALLIYYKGNIWDFNPVPSSLSVIPQGLRMIAGDAANDHDLTVNAQGQPTWVDPHYKYTCMDPANSFAQVGPATVAVPNCANGLHLWTFLTFPRCWDGVNLDSADHKSHMKYTSGGACPGTHPVKLPAISYVVKYALTNGQGQYLRLSSDMYSSSVLPGYSMHGDYWMKWDQTTMNQLVNGCINAYKDCHVDQLGNGQQLY